MRLCHHWEGDGAAAQMALSRGGQPATMDPKTKANHEWTSLICCFYWVSSVQLPPLGSVEVGHLLKGGSSCLLGWSSSEDVQGVVWQRMETMSPCEAGWKLEAIFSMWFAPRTMPDRKV